MVEFDAHQRNLLIWTGIAAIVGAVVVGIGEFTFQFSPKGGYEGTDYLYFLDVSTTRLTWGHFIGVLAAPLYLVGYWHVAQMLRPAGQWISRAVFGLGVYAFVIGDVWLGGRVNLALTVQAREIAAETAQPVISNLLAEIAAHNEPLINIVRVLVLVISVLMIYSIVSGRSPYPRWMVAFTPITILILIFLLYAVAPAIGVYVLPAAMNISHAVFFVFSTWVAARVTVTNP